MKKIGKYLFTILCLLFLTTGVNAQNLNYKEKDLIKVH